LTLIEALILGVIQGLAEFFPISSSAHLALAKIVLQIQDDPSHLFDLICHVGTFFAALIFFRKDILKVLTNFRLCMLFFAALVPLVPAYFFAKPLIHSLSDPKYLGYFFLLTALLLLIATFAREKSSESAPKFKDVLFIGVMQTMALLPGISRSGSTIAAALFRGFEIREAVRFSFLLALPAVFGGALLETIHVMRTETAHLNLLTYFLGFSASFLTGLISVKLIYWSLSKKGLRYFAIYLSVIALFTFFITGLKHG